MITIDELIYDPAKGRDIAHPIALDYDPKQYTNIPEAAYGLYEALVKLAVSQGQKPTEVFILNPGQSEKHGTGKNWRVCWEAGPYQWAIGACFAITGPWGYTEPYYSFDVCFAEL